MGDGATEHQLDERSLKNLRGVDPRLVAMSIRASEICPIRFVITEGKRLMSRQRELFADPRKITHTMHSMHLEQEDGWAHAVDVMAAGDLDGDGDVDAQDKDRTWDRHNYTTIAAAYAMAAAELNYSVRWGGTFKSFFDGPHFETEVEK